MQIRNITLLTNYKKLFRILIQMSRSNFPPRPDGHLTAMSQNRDLEQKLTYQQLLNLNHDLTKENQQLKNISDRLGQELRDLHLQFQIKPRQENSDLYAAIGNHPVLHNFQVTLIPLFDAYQEKIQNFQHSFETIYEEFIMLEKKFEEVTSENEGLKLQLTDKIRENIELYKTGSSSKLSSDFGQLVMQQVTEKQKILLEENSRLETQFQRYKSQSQRYKRELLETKTNYEQSKNRLKQIDIRFRNQQGELKISKENCFTHQQRNNQLQSEKNKLEQALQRAQSQINTIIKERDFYLKKYDEYRNKLESNVNFGSYDEKQEKVIEELKSKISYLEAEKVPSDQAKKYSKLTGAFDSLTKENTTLKETIEEIMMKKSQLADHARTLQTHIDKLQTQINELSISESKLRVTVKQLSERQKAETQRFRKQQKQKLQSLESEWSSRVQDKQHKIEQLEEDLEKITLEKYNLEKENQLFNGMESRSQSKQSVKDSERLIEKMTQKMNLNKDIMQEKIDVLKNQSDHLKKEKDSLASQNKSLKEEIRKLRQNLDNVTASLTKVTEEKTRLTESIRRVRDEYDGQLKDKEKIFHQRIEQIKRAIEQSDKKRKSEREKVLQISRKYQNAVEELKRMYQENPSFREDSKNQKGSRVVF